MQKIFLFLTLWLCAGTALAQNTPDMHYPAKYQVYKITLKSNKATKGGAFRETKSWDVSKLLVTVPETRTAPPTVWIYNTVGQFYLKTVGAPAYRIVTSRYEGREQLDNGIVEETYSGVYNYGQIAPPTSDVIDPFTTNGIIWRTAVSGNKSLTVQWESDETKQGSEGRFSEGGSKYMYRLIFYCRPVQM